jgi:D-lactate dehydrogenase
MRLSVFSAKRYERSAFESAVAASAHELRFFEEPLTAQTTALADGADAVCVFVNDELDAVVVDALALRGVRAIALRCAGCNNVDLRAANDHGVRVVHVPAYSPNAVAEHTIALLLAVNRNIPRAYNRVRDGNFSLDGLVGFDLAGKTVGVVGTGKIGRLVARLLWHFRCEVIAHDPVPDAGLGELGVRYVDLEDVWAQSDIISLNCPLDAATRHLVSATSIARMKRGVVLVNTGRGALVDTAAVIDGLKRGHIGGLALDVYEEEAALFFEDRSSELITDDVFARLLTFPNVVVTAHQGFLTREALDAIAQTTIANLDALAAGAACPNELRVTAPR